MYTTKIDNVSCMRKFIKFNITKELVNNFKLNRQIPLHFYNREGQILVYSKTDASEEDITKLLRFNKQGIYYDKEDESILQNNNKSDIPEGLTDTKLISEKIADKIIEGTSSLFDQLRNNVMSSIHAKNASSKLSNIFTEFENQEDILTGLVNIIEIMNNRKNSLDIALATKRTTVAMAIKTRGIFTASESEKEKRKEMISDLMLSALLCDTGTTKMKMPVHRGLLKEEMDYIRNHPLLSYLMVAHESGIKSTVKHNILCHHRPLREGTVNNNYPSYSFLIKKLEFIKNKYQSEPGHIDLIKDIDMQIYLLKNDTFHDDDANILAIASEFSSLTSEVPWREAFSPVDAVRKMINNSLFTYSDRSIREFLDYIAISLCDNQKIINDGNFVIVNILDSDNKSHFEICTVVHSDRFQSRPTVERFATIRPIIKKDPKIHISGFDLNSITLDPRRARFNLRNDDSRHIIYLVDCFEDEALHDKLSKISKFS